MIGKVEKNIGVYEFVDELFYSRDIKENERWSSSLFHINLEL